MSDWVLVPCLVTLRAEFNAVAPGRRRGADGSIGDSNHTSASDHSPDEDSAVLRDHDTDHKNEVHALDIDSAGPWPGGPAWFDAAVKGIVDRHRRGLDDRLQYVIWNRQIANADVENWKWRPYRSTKDPHLNHAHFSSRYTTVQESDTSPWGVTGEADMPLTNADLDEVEARAQDGATAALVGFFSRANRAARGVTSVSEGGKTRILTSTELAGDRQILGMLRNAVGGPTEDDISAATATLLAAINGDNVSAEQIAAQVLAGLDPQKIAAAIPPTMAVQVADELARRLHD